MSFINLNHDVYHRGDIIDYCMEDSIHNGVVFPYIKDNNLNACGNLKVLIKSMKTEEICRLLESLSTICTRWENRLVVTAKEGIPFVGEVMIKNALNCLQISIDYWCKESSFDAVYALLKAVFKDHESDVKDAIVMDVDWYYMGKENEVGQSGIQELLYETVHPEAYPYLEMDKFIEGFFKSSSSVLIICGIPGTGKTKLIRHLIRRAIESGAEFINKFRLKHRYGPLDDEDYGPEVARNENDPKRAKVAYTMDMGVMSNDDFYLRMRTNNYQFVVLEDIDFKLGSRAEGNDVMHKFLAASDGFITSNYKVIMTTNLNVTDIDSALLRPGRCYASIETRKLSYEESMALARKLNASLSLENREYSLAEIYGLAYNLSYEKNPVKAKIGFGKK